MAKKTPRHGLIGLLGTTGLSVALLGGTMPAAEAAPAIEPARTWVIDADTLTTGNIEEDAPWENGDEPYIAVIGFRSRLATANSTVAVFAGGLRELATGADDDRVLTIPDSMGRMSFPSVARVTFDDIVAGTMPEIIGTITVAMESDLTPFSRMHEIFTDLAKTTKTEIANVVEKTTIADILATVSADPVVREAARNRIADRVEAAVNRIKNSVLPSLGSKIGIFFQSFTNPDDLVAFRVSAFAAVRGSLATALEREIQKALPPEIGFGGALKARTAVQIDFKDKPRDGDYRYRVAFNVF